MDLFEEFSQLVAAFKREKIDYALCGGLAMAVYAFPRATLDIDILIEQDTLEKVKATARGLGFSIDAGLMKFKEGRIHIYRLTKTNPKTDEALMLDMLLVTPELRDVWASKQLIAWDHGELPVVSPEGLIKLKSLRLSGQDQDDIKNLKSLLNED